jgi:hypothetical protein
LGSLSVVTGLGLTVAGLVLLIQRKPRLWLAAVLVSAVVPLMLGLGGAGVSFLAVNDAIAASHDVPVSPQSLAQGLTRAWTAAFAGFVSAIPVAVVGIIGVCRHEPASIRNPAA